LNRTILLNGLIRERHASRYLEIGVGLVEENFAHIQCAEKVGVDPRSGATFQRTSDEFFAQNGGQFDVIFIDGQHTEAQTLADLDSTTRWIVSHRGARSCYTIVFLPTRGISASRTSISKVRTGTARCGRRR
jgi:predicted O-methyltransferase YrrM